MSPEEQARLLQDMKDQFIRSVADLLTLKAKVEGAGPPLELGMKGMPSMGDYLLDLSRLGVSFYQSLLDLNAAYFEKLAASMPAAKKGKRKSKRPLIKLKAIVGTNAESASFDVEIENRSHVEGRFTFMASDFRVIGEGEPVRPPITIVPARPLIRAGGSERVMIVVPVAGVFQPGQKYKGRISVRGPCDSEIILRLRVQERG